MIDVIWLEKGTLRCLSTINMKVALSIWAQLGREGLRARVWRGSEMLRGWP